MSALALAAAVLLAGKCAPQVAPETLLSVARLESALDPLAIHDNTAGTRLSPADLPVAALFAADLIAQGHSVDLGLMQVNSASLRSLHLTILGAFDPCASMRAGGAVLQQAYTGGKSVDEQQHALRVALSRYNTGGPVDGFANGYVHRVEVAAESIVPAISPGPYPNQPPAPRANPAARTWDVWGDDSAPPAAPPQQTSPSPGNQKAAPRVHNPGPIKRTL